MMSKIRERIGPLLPTRFRSYLAARTGSYRAFVGPPDAYDLQAASQFNLLTLLGLREHHYLLDVGCGALRSGRLFLAYLQPGRYFGIEPERWLLEAAIDKEVGRDVVRLKRPVFDHGREFQLTVFGRSFDFVLATSIFSHASQGQIATCLREAAQVLTSSGVMLASFTPGTENYAGNEWRYPEMVAYTPERLEELAAAHGLLCEAVEWPYVAGRQAWLAFRRTA